MVKKISAVAIAVVLGVLFTGGTAWAEEQQNFTLLGVNSETTTVIATGAIIARGVEEVIEETFNDETGEFTLITSFVFEDGTVFATVEATTSFTFNELSCLGRFTGTGTYDITGGSGDFEGATGDGTVKARGTFVAGRNADGSCSDDEADEQFNFFSAQLRGDIASDGAEAA